MLKRSETNQEAVALREGTAGGNVLGLETQGASRKYLNGLGGGLLYKKSKEQNYESAFY